MIRDQFLPRVGLHPLLPRLVSPPLFVDVSRIVYAAHLGLVDEVYAALETAQLGPVGGASDVMGGPDGYRTSLQF